MNTSSCVLSYKPIMAPGLACPSGPNILHHLRALLRAACSLALEDRLLLRRESLDRDLRVRRLPRRVLQGRLHGHLLLIGVVEGVPHEVPDHPEGLCRSSGELL